MSLLDKKYILTSISGNTDVIHNMREFIKDFGLRRFAVDFGFAFDEHKPSLSYYGTQREYEKSNEYLYKKEYSSKYILDFFYSGEAVDPIDIAIEFLNENPDYFASKCKLYSFGTAFYKRSAHKRRRHYRRVAIGLHTKLMERERALEFGFKMGRPCGIGEIYEDDYFADKKDRNWKKFRKQQYK